MKSKFGIKKSDRSKILEILERSKVGKVFIFGSRSRGNFRLNSDIDLVVFGKVEFNDYLGLLADVKELDIPHRVDFVVFEDIDNELLKANILRDKKPFVA
jgi:uncharacterized protein